MIPYPLTAEDRAIFVRGPSQKNSSAWHSLAGMLSGHGRDVEIFETGGQHLTPEARASFGLSHKERVEARLYGFLRDGE